MIFLLVLLVFIGTGIAAIYKKEIRKWIGVICFGLGSLLCVTIIGILPGILLMAWGVMFLFLSR